MSASVTSSRVARKAATRWVGRSEIKPTVSERIACAARGQIEAPHRRVEGREQHVFGGDRRAGQAVEQRRFPGIGVADQRHHRIGHAAARLAMQRPRPLDVVELALQPGDALADQPAVDFELALAGSAEKAETAALAFEMGPRPDQPRALVRQRRQLDLQPAFMGARPRAENFEDQAGAVDDLGLPAPFEIALLHRAQRAVDDDEPDLVFADQPAQILDGPAAEQAAGARPRDPGDLGAHDVEVDGPRQTDRLLEPGLDRAAWRSRRLPAGAAISAPDGQRARAGRNAVRAIRRVCAAQGSAISLPASNSWIGCPGITVEIACL